MMDSIQSAANAMSKAIKAEVDVDDQDGNLGVEPSDSDQPIPVSLMVAPPGSQNNVVIQMMDIAEPLGMLRTLLSNRLDCFLVDHEIHLQNTTVLDPEKSLLEQGVKAEGVVQFSVQIISNHGVKPIINIVDIVKPIIESMEIPVTQNQVLSVEAKSEAKLLVKYNDQITQLIVCHNYQEELEKHNIPTDPNEWTMDQTGHWLNWTTIEFGLNPPNGTLDGLRVPGDQLCAFTKEEFLKGIPKDMGDIYWTHLQVIRKSKDDTSELPVSSSTQAAPVAPLVLSTTQSVAFCNKARPPKSPRTPKLNPTSENRILPGNRTGNNGQIQLWQFLLDLLTDWQSYHYIRWVGDEGEFKLIDAETVAQKWGLRKNKNSMNYEKLSRALRYYYDGDMIAKVHGKRFGYKFVCNLKELIGYDAAELKKLVTEAYIRNDTPAILNNIPGFTQLLEDHT